MSAAADRTATRLAHLEIANDVRVGRRRFKQAIRSGELQVADVLRNPEGWPVGTLPVYELLMMAPYWGLVKVSKLLRRTEVWPLRPAGRLTQNQRNRLIRGLEGQ